MREFLLSLGNVWTVPFADVFNKVRLLFGKDEEDDDDEDCCSNSKNWEYIKTEKTFWGERDLYKCKKCGNYIT